MSANIYWEPVKKNPETLYVSAPSSFMEALRAGGIEIPGVVTREHLPILRALAVQYPEVHSERNPYIQLTDIVDEHDEVRIWPEY